MEIESYSYSGQDPRGDPLCNTTCQLRCADIDLAQTESWLARQVSCSTADGRVSAPPLAQTADTLNVSLLYHRGHLQPPRHLSVGRCAAWPRVDALSVCSRCRLFNYLPHCRHWGEDYKSKSSQFRGKRLIWLDCHVLCPAKAHSELNLSWGLTSIWHPPCHVCMLMFTATVEQQVDPSTTQLECRMQMIHSSSSWMSFWFLVVWFVIPILSVRPAWSGKFINNYTE